MRGEQLSSSLLKCLSFYEHLFAIEIPPLQLFEMASADDLDFYKKDAGTSYCRVVIDFNRQKLSEHFAGVVK